MKKSFSILGIILLLSGLGLAIYGTNVPYQYYYPATETDDTRIYFQEEIKDGYKKSFMESVLSGGWMNISILSTEDVEILVTRPLGQVYQATSKYFSQNITFGFTGNIAFTITNPSQLEMGASAYITGTFIFQHTGLKSETRYQQVSLYILLGGFLLCGGIGFLIYGGKSTKLKKHRFTKRMDA